MLNQTLATPVGAAYVYSDLSMITLMYVIGKLVRTAALVDPAALMPACISTFATGPWQDQCYYEAYIRAVVVEHFKLQQTGFLPPRKFWGRCAPTWNDTTGDTPGPAYRHM